MLTEQRHEIILNLLSEKGSITVTELKEVLNTSESTIRRDLNTLDEQGRLTKVFGGAVEKKIMVYPLPNYQFHRKLCLILKKKKNRNVCCKACSS